MPLRYVGNHSPASLFADFYVRHLHFIYGGGNQALFGFGAIPLGFLPQQDQQINVQAGQFKIHGRPAAGRIRQMAQRQEYRRDMLLNQKLEGSGRECPFFFSASVGRGDGPADGVELKESGACLASPTFLASSSFSLSACCFQPESTCSSWGWTCGCCSGMGFLQSC
jgi:hypothetical protein